MMLKSGGGPLGHILLSSPEALEHSLQNRTDRSDTDHVHHSLLVCFQTGGGSHPPLFFVHGFAGNVPRFNNLIRHLGSDESIYVLQEPSVDGTQPILTRIEDMAAQYISDIQIVQPKGPYYLAGYSFSGLVAFEMGRQLHAQGHDVPLVALIDAGQPIYRKHRADVFLSPRMLGTYLRRIKELLSDPGSRSTVRSRIQNELWRLMFFKLKLPLPGAGRHLDQADSRPIPRTSTMLQAAKMEAAVTYEPKPFAGRLSIFRVQERTIVDRFDRNLGWSGLADKGIEVYDVPGDHVSMGEEPHVAVLGEKLRLAIRAARDSHA